MTFVTKLENFELGVKANTNVFQISCENMQQEKLLIQKVERV